jgi:hypothetical protein
LLLITRPGLPRVSDYAHLNAGAGASLLQAMHEGPAVRQQLHQRQREV